MSSYLSSLLTSSTEKYHTLRRTLASENDGDTEDDSHITRVLRAYYIDNGRSLPSWLPGDPKRPPPVTVTSSQNYGSYTQSPATYKGQTPSSGRSTLADLWGPAPGQDAQQTQQPQSVRYGRQPAAPMQRPAEGLQRQESGSSTAGTAQERLKARLWGQKQGGSSAGGASSTGGGYR